MTSDESKEDWLRMYHSLNDPEERERAKNEADQKKRREERMADTGAYIITP